MRIQRVVPDLTVADLAAAPRQHTAVLGLTVAMDHDDVQAAHENAVAAGVEIVSTWGPTPEVEP